ncbi:MAG: GNAT family N-acetyltransferase [Planctomycetota bacterium]|jgi:CelD/BcsL family acetyltransferase involved in cellulose biosynthesis
MKLTTVRALEELESIRSVWEQMQRDEHFTVFYTDIKRYVATIKALGGDTQPYITLVESDSHPAVMAIGRVEKRRFDFKVGYKRLFSKTLRCLSIVYGGILGRQSDDSCTALVRGLVDALRRRKADVVLLNRLRTDSLVYKLCRTVPHLLTRSHFVRPQLHWQTDIPATTEEFYDRIPASRKRRWSRNLKQLEAISSSEIKVVCYRRPSDIDYLVDVAYRIERSTYKHPLEVGFSGSALNRAMLEQAAEDGWLRAYVLYVDDDPCAFQFDVQYGGVQFSEYGSFDPRRSRGSPGTVLLTKVLEQLCREPDVHTIDYGFGDASWKAKFGTHCWPEKSVYIFAPRLHPIMINMGISANRAACLALRRAMTFVKLDSFVKRKWRRMLSGRSQ